jgi:DMSO/TMAO reductase YedYZ heme-binding membrane subunit
VNPHPWWYVARASGLVAWFLLTGSMLAGASLPFRRARSRSALLDTHRVLGGFAVLLTVAHVAALLADRFVDYGPLQVLVPFASLWRPGPVAWGVVSFYLLVVVEGSSLARRYMSVARWRRLHILSYPMFGMTTIHFLSAGSDVHRWIPTWLAIIFGGVIVASAVWGNARARQRMENGPAVPGPGGGT